jgi:CubicO group peptidase (beta-lactamase class C family)
VRQAGLLLAVAVVASTASAQADRRPAPNVARLRYDTARLERAYARAADLSRSRSLLVQHRGRLIRERYFHGASRSTRTNIKSASKSIISLLTGIAIARGHIRDVHQTVGELLPADARDLESAKRAITVQDLLSMRAGLQSTSFDNYGAWVTSRNWVRAALRQPLIGQPGGSMIYSTGSSHLLSAIITRRSRVSTYAFAERYLARPLGIDLRPWQTDPQGIFFGGNDMYLMPRDMLKIGTLLLDKGSVRGRQLVPRAWLDSSIVPRTVSPFNGNRYGYGWWIRNAQGHDVIYAWGYGGQFIFVVPDLELVIVATSDAEARREWGHTDALHSIVEDEIVPAFAP